MKLPILEQIGHNRASFSRISTLHLVAQIGYPGCRVMSRANLRPAPPGALTLPPPQDGFSLPGDGRLWIVFFLGNRYFLTFLRYEAVPAGSGVPALKDVAMVKTRLQRVSGDGEHPRGRGASVGRGSIRSRRPQPLLPICRSPRSSLSAPTTSSTCKGCWTGFWPNW